jgi:hypothetical protein
MFGLGWVRISQLIGKHQPKEGDADQGHGLDRVHLVDAVDTVDLLQHACGGFGSLCAMA